MEFESLNWNVEAQRIARAFRCDESCYFKNDGYGRYELVSPDETGMQLRCEPSGLLLTCFYWKPYGRYFYLDTQPFTNGISIDWSGFKRFVVGSTGDALLVKGLLRLGFLTPEIQAALTEKMTAHEKLELLLELETLNEL